MPLTVITEPISDSTKYDADGNPWQYALRQGEATALSDSLTEIVAHLFPEYAEFDATAESDERALQFRWAKATEAANTVQATWVAQAIERGVWDPSDERDEDRLNAIVGNRELPVDGILRWEEPIPLVLISTDYAPYTDRPLPEGHLYWINPHTEMTFLMSLTDLGAIEFMVHADA